MHARENVQPVKDHPGTTFPFYLPEWQVQTSRTVFKLIRTFELGNEIEARRFAGRVISEALTHGKKPNVHIYQKWVCVIWRIPIEAGIHINDCLLPRIVNDLYRSWEEPIIQ